MPPTQREYDEQQAELEGQEIRQQQRDRFLPPAGHDFAASVQEYFGKLSDSQGWDTHGLIEDAIAELIEDETNPKALAVIHYLRARS